MTQKNVSTNPVTSYITANLQTKVTSGKTREEELTRVLGPIGSKGEQSLRALGLIRSCSTKEQFAKQVKGCLQNSKTSKPGDLMKGMKTLATF